MKKPMVDHVCEECYHFAQPEEDGCNILPGWKVGPKSKACSGAFTPIGGRIRPTRARGKGVKP